MDYCNSFAWEADIWLVVKSVFLTVRLLLTNPFEKRSVLNSNSSVLQILKAFFKKTVLAANM